MTKARDIADRTVANAALPKAGGAMTGPITTNSTFDGVDIATRDAVLTATTTTANAALPKSGGTMTGDITRGGTVIQDGTITDTGDFTLDAAGDIVLDADSDLIKVFASGTQFGTFYSTGSNFLMYSAVSDKDIIFQGNDGGSTITALTLDMSDAGTAIFNHDISLGDNQFIFLGAGQDLTLRGDGTNGLITSPNGNLTLDAGGDIILDADGEDIRFKDGGVQTFVFSMGGGSTMATPRGSLTLDVAGDIILNADGGNINFMDAATSIFHISNDNSGDVHLESQVSDKDLYIRGNDGGSIINAVYFDMSAAGAATFNAGATLNGSLNVTGEQSGDYLAKLTSTNTFGLKIKTTSTSDAHEQLGIYDYNNNLKFKVMGGGTVHATGINLGGSGAANRMDDYEEGDYTPAKNNGGSVSYSAQGGHYTKVGELVTVYMDMTISSASGESGSTSVTLPFTSKSGNNYMGFVPWVVDTGYTGSSRANGYVNSGSGVMLMYCVNSDNSSGAGVVNNNATGRWSGVFTYFAA